MTLRAAMAGGDVRLEPLAQRHRTALKAACAEDTAIWSLYSWSWDPDHFDGSFDALRSRTDAAAFAIVQRDALVGMTAFLAVDRRGGVLEIGNTYYAPRIRGTGFNGRVKAIMLDRVFDDGFRRVEFRVDARNRRSQNALLKLGATREGRLRADGVTWTGHVRDTILFSILADEWAAMCGTQEAAPARAAR